MIKAILSEAKAAVKPEKLIVTVAVVVAVYFGIQWVNKKIAAQKATA